LFIGQRPLQPPPTHKTISRHRGLARGSLMAASRDRAPVPTTDRAERNLEHLDAGSRNIKGVFNRMGEPGAVLTAASGPRVIIADLHRYRIIDLEYTVAGASMNPMP
jgi:hypothetical protein